MSFGPVEAIVIVVVVLVVFGAGRLSGVEKALGQGLREFREEAKVEDESATDESATDESADDEEKAKEEETSS